MKKSNIQTPVSQPPKPPYPMEQAGMDPDPVITGSGPAEDEPLGGCMPDTQTTATWKVAHLAIVFGGLEH